MAKILYVEDNLSLRFVTSDQLKKRGYQVVSCEDGKEALSTFKEQVFDLCVLDIMLPQIDGFELAKKIRQENERAEQLLAAKKSRSRSPSLSNSFGPPCIRKHNCINCSISAQVIDCFVNASNNPNCFSFHPFQGIPR